MKFEKFISRKYRKNRHSALVSFISLTSIIGITLGVATLIMTINVMSGFSNILRDKIVGANSHIIVNKASMTLIPDWYYVQEDIEAVEGVKAVSPFIMSQSLVQYGNLFQGISVRAVIPEEEVLVSNVGDSIILGDFLAMDNYDKAKEVIDGFVGENAILGGSNINPEGLPESKPITLLSLPTIAIGSVAATNLGLGIGDVIELLSPNGASTPFGFVPKVQKFVVVAIFSSGVYEYDAALLYMSLNSAQQFYGFNDQISGFSVKTNSFKHAAQTADAINDKLGIIFSAKDWLSLNSSLFAALKLEEAAMFLILIIIIVVSSFNIASVVAVTTRDKKRDIGIMKSMGATDRSITNIFLRLGFFLGLTGTILGNIIALVLSYILGKYKIIELSESVYNVDTIPIQIIPSAFVIVSISSLIITLLAAYFPAKHASKMEPLEGIRDDS